MAWKVRPDARALDAVENEQRYRHHDKAEIVVVDRIVEIDRQHRDVGERRNKLDALGSAEQPGQLAPLPHQPDDFACGEGADQEIEPLHAEQGKAQQKGEEGRDRCADQHGERHWPGKFLGDERRAIGANTHDHGMGQRPLPGQRQQPVTRDQEHVDHQKDQDFLLRKRNEMRQHDQRRRKQDQAEREGQSTRGPLRHVPSLRTGRLASRSTR